MGSLFTAGREHPVPASTLLLWMALAVLTALLAGNLTATNKLAGAMVQMEDQIAFNNRMSAYDALLKSGRLTPKQYAELVNRDLQGRRL